MRLARLATLFLLFGATPTRAQSTPPSRVETRPFRLDAASLKALFVHCEPTTLADAANAAHNALLKGAVTAVIEVLAVDSPEGRTASEFFSALVSKLGPTAAYGAINEIQLRTYRGKGYKPTDPFEVCTSTVGPSPLALVRPATPVWIPAPNTRTQNLPTASLPELKASIFGTDADSFTLARFATPLCSPHSNDIMSQMRLGSVGLYPLYGTVSKIQLNGNRPVGGARVDVIGPSPQSCITSNVGQFDFSVSEGQYTVTARDTEGWDASVDVQVGVLGKYVDITLLPVSIGGTRPRQ